ncbi:hypothetical protein QEZ48_19695 [Aquamicrobium lusatiense]|uniref:hypothetical protein n=1 Tax=Aquamicrobium lusatiense TaxID=89772 RepID=UPI002454C987|nr:hypothetical protein [Aquamicrobium lusatiense]MDH4993042.1 hypothetical protein [Aquamicrobium lusatiense]
MGLNREIPARDAGYQNIQYLRKDITFADAGPVVVGTLPAGAVIVKPISGVAVHTAFNNATTNTLNIGTEADGDFYATAIATGAIAYVALDEAVSGKVDVDTTITATQAVSGAAATAGSASVIIAYIPAN